MESPGKSAPPVEVGSEVLNDGPAPTFAPENPPAHTFCQMNKAAVLRLKRASESPGGLVKTDYRSTSIVFNSTCLG